MIADTELSGFAAFWRVSGERMETDEASARVIFRAGMQAERRRLAKRLRAGAALQGEHLRERILNQLADELDGGTR